ncbi:MAG: RdgB/HAM1 family non-canonical purine NTP pyrophosphatase [Melioribacteraceae bacterium]|nr:RdgB/HAM1 family non-canonical purine NTP pyrophosphatase [Melioribacteraceae bacterium]
MDKLIFATGNNGKLAEVKKIFADTGIEITAPFELGETAEVEETGSTFEENAFIKAEAIYAKYKLPVIADDSGLEIDQLDGRPGIISARYAGENCTYDDNNNKVLEELKSMTGPHTARFICCAVYFDGVKKYSATGKLEGTIIKDKKGANGFGYDPVFVPKNMDKTLAELSMQEKNKLSHRYKAFEKLKGLII